MSNWATLTAHTRCLCMATFPPRTGSSSFCDPTLLASASLFASPASSLASSQNALAPHSSPDLAPVCSHWVRIALHTLSSVHNNTYPSSHPPTLAFAHSHSLSPTFTRSLSTTLPLTLAFNPTPTPHSHSHSHLYSLEPTYQYIKA